MTKNTSTTIATSLKLALAAITLTCSTAALAAQTVGTDEITLSALMDFSSSCTINPTTVDFGTISDASQSEYKKSVQIEVSCTNVPPGQAIALINDSQNQSKAKGSAYSYSEHSTTPNSTSYSVGVAHKVKDGSRPTYIGIKTITNGGTNVTATFDAEFYMWMTPALFNNINNDTFAAGKKSHNLAFNIPFIVSFL